MSTPTYPIFRTVGQSALTYTILESGNRVFYSYGKAIAVYNMFDDTFRVNDLVNHLPLKDANGYNTITTKKHLKQVWDKHSPFTDNIEYYDSLADFNAYVDLVISRG